VLAQMCARLVVILDMTGLSDAALSGRLGYANATTLSSARRGLVFPDVERLASLGAMVLSGKVSPNLHWILTGVGSPFLATPRHRTGGAAELDAMNKVALLRLGGDKRGARSCRRV